MDTIRYDVGIINVSDEVIVIPWSAVVINRRDRPAAGYRHALFELTLKKDGYEEEFVVATFVLYGAPTVRNSLRVVRPGETVVVRLSGILSGNGYQDGRNPVLYPAPTMPLRVGIIVFAPGDPLFERFHAEVSENALPLTILPPLPSP
jgi:hypothetical protein